MKEHYDILLKQVWGAKLKPNKQKRKTSEEGRMKMTSYMMLLFQRAFWAVVLPLGAL